MLINLDINYTGFFRLEDHGSIKGKVTVILQTLHNTTMRM
jgi:hypothetical protein